MPLAGSFGAVLVALLLVAGCALPPETALRDWARTASVVADRPSLLPPDDALLARQEALAVYLYALGLLAAQDGPVPFRAEAHDAIAARAGDAARDLGRVLRRAREARTPAEDQAQSAYPAPLVEDRRLRPTILAADASVQALVASLSTGIAAAGTGPDGATYQRLLAALGKDHAMIAARSLHLDAREVARGIRAAEDRLLRLARLLPPDPAVAARGPAGGAVARVVQP